MKNIEDIVDDITSDLPIATDVVVTLPSENRVYNLEDPSKPITLRPMTFEDEKMAVTAPDTMGGINLILQRCITNISVGELLPMDRLYLLLKLREISYGDDFKTTIICQHCTHENPVTIKLSELPVNPVPDDFQEPVTYELPSIKKEIQLRYPRINDLDNVEGTIVDNLWRFVSSIAGETNSAVIAQVLKKLPLYDLKLILKLIETDFGVDTSVKLECSECGGISVVQLPLDANFFSVSL